MNQITLSRDRQQPRHLIVIEGEASAFQDFLDSHLKIGKHDVLCISENNEFDFESIEPSKFQQYLGREKLCVVVDLTNGINADALAAMSSVVVGGGAFILLLPSKQNKESHYSTAFAKRVLSFIEESSDLYKICLDKNESVKIIDARMDDKTARFIPTNEQQHVIDAILTTEYDDVPIVLTADRGRGKSAALGMTCARMIEKGIKYIAIVAPRYDATAIIFKHIEASFDSCQNDKGKFVIDSKVIQFYAPDYFLLQNIQPDLLIIDEAAAIPVPVLQKLVKQVNRVVMATTVHGYEGTGRGFQFRFRSWLDSNYPEAIYQELKQPVRWADNDQLESWIFKLLCLDAELPQVKIENLSPEEIDFQKIPRQELENNENLLRQVFALLVLAHYRTRPSDLQYLLDQEQLSIYAAMHKGVAVAIALVNHEGEFSDELSVQVYRGQRRPTGHLLAQSLTYHCGNAKAATLKCSRIMRISVHPDLQGKGIGSSLISYIVESEIKSKQDIIGSSFGLNQRLWNFWNNTGFKLARVGFKREQVSGEHSAMVVMSLSTKGDNVVQHAVHNFACKFPYWRESSLKDLNAKYLDNIPDLRNNPACKKINLRELDDYLNYSRSYELSIDVIHKLVEEYGVKSNLTDKERDLIKSKVEEHQNWKQVATANGLSGKAEAQNRFKQVVKKIVKNFENV